MARRRWPGLVGVSLLLLQGCSGDGGGGSGAGGGAGTDGGTGGGDAGACEGLPSSFPAGDPDGHAAPFGARAAGQARAGRVRDAADVVQPHHGRQRVNAGDFVLANRHLAAYVEGPGTSDGYNPFGGELLAISRVGDDGRPLAESTYVETLVALSIEAVKPTRVTVLNDGSDGGPAVVRAEGTLTPIPFLDGSLGVIFPRRYGLPAALDYVLAPDARHLEIRLGLLNATEEAISFAPFGASDEMHGFFHANWNQLATPSRGFDRAQGDVPWAGFVGPRASFVWRAGEGAPLEPSVEISGFQYFLGPGFEAAACSEHWRTHVQVTPGGFEHSGMLAALRADTGAPPWREVTGRVLDATGAPVPGAWVHVLDARGTWLTRTRADASGRYSVEVPPGESVRLDARSAGHAPGLADVGASDATRDVGFPPHGTLEITATEAGTGRGLPVRVQVIPTTPGAATPEAYGVLDPAGGRLHMEFDGDGRLTLPVPPGEHRVIVSRGPEWEMLDRTVNVAAGASVTVDASLEHSVDTRGVMCADFHIHSQQSADSTDAVDLKVLAALGDGLDIPVSSEHEWVIDFQPVIERLGLADWAFGMSSEELTTFTWGHFGVVPLLPRPDAPNNGAVDWVGKSPREVFATVQALPESPVLIVNHPSGGGFGAYFSQARFDRTTGAGRNAELWSDDFDAIEVFNDTDFDSVRDQIVRDWFALLEAGHTFWAVGSSDSHKVRTSPVGYPRTCLLLGTDDPHQLTANRVRDVLAQGRATVSGGLFMTVEGPDGSGPGSSVPVTGAEAAFTVTVQAPSWVDASELEVWVNGALVETQTLAPLGGGPARRWVNVVTVPVDANRARSWVVFHARGLGTLDPVLRGKRPFAVSNPVFLTR